MSMIDEISHKRALEVFHCAFVRRVGVGPARVSYSELERLTDIPVRTLKSWREGAAMPQLENLLKLAAVFGPAFMSELLHPIGQGGVELIDHARSDAVTCLADLAAPLHDISRRLADGVFCHADKASVGPQLIDLAHRIEEQGQAMLDESRAGPGC